MTESERSVIKAESVIYLRVVQMGVHFTFEFNLGDRRRQADGLKMDGLKIVLFALMVSNIVQRTVHFRTIATFYIW